MTEVIIEDWKEKIKNSWESSLTKMIADKDVLCNWVPFYETIWEMSQKAFDIPREVQVVIDANDNLFISVGDPGFVSFEGDEGQLSGMKMPIFSWIHTHPFGDAQFSSRDLLTISMWERFMQHAIVLGDGERQIMSFRKGKNGAHIQEYTQYTWIGDEEE